MGDWGAFEEKLKAEGLSESFIASFKNCYDKLISGSATNIPESEITPVISALLLCSSICRELRARFLGCGATDTRRAEGQIFW